MSPSVPSQNDKREFASEIKFVLDAVTAERVRAWARQHLIADPNAKGATGDTYRVASLYLDTPEFLVYQRDEFLRYSKYRIRRYNESVLFLERKLKVSGQVAKRRTTIGPEELARIAAGQPAAPGWEGAWFDLRTSSRRLRPVCQIDYFRTARVLLTPEGPIRLTLDENIRAQPTQGARFQADTAAAPLTDKVVLELKYRRTLPVLFRTLAAEFGLNPLPFSKYRTAVKTLGLAPEVPLAPSPASSAATTATPPLNGNLLACPTS